MTGIMEVVFRPKTYFKGITAPVWKICKITRAQLSKIAYAIFGKRKSHPVANPPPPPMLHTKIRNPDRRPTDTTRFFFYKNHSTV